MSGPVVNSGSAESWPGSIDRDAVLAANTAEVTILLQPTSPPADVRDGAITDL